MKANFHTHNYRCGHATGNVEDYVEEALKNNYSVIGISDHSPLPKYHFDRMGMNELEGYLIEIEEAQKKYDGKIKIYKSLEIEYFEDLEGYYEELRGKLDYLLLGMHTYVVNGKLKDSWVVSTENEMIEYARHMEKAINSGLFDIVAHPDLYVSSKLRWTNAAMDAATIICKAALEKDVPLEVNANGIRKMLPFDKNPKRYRYPYKEFWEVVKFHGNKVMVSSDCHAPEDLDDESMEFARKFARDLDLNIIETIF